MNHAPLTYDEIEAAISAAIAERDTTIAELRAALNEAARYITKLAANHLTAVAIHVRNKYRAIAEGWKPISEIANEPENPDTAYQLASFFEGELFPLAPILDKPKYGFIKYFTKDIEQDCDGIALYRRLIPASPNTVMISREDAEIMCGLLIAPQHHCDAEAEKIYATQNRIRALLEGK